MNITLRQIDVFLAVARTLSFSQAASLCHLSQPALSATVKKLEDTLSVRLFERTTRTVSLTVVGLEFQRLAEQLVDNVQQVQIRIKDYANGQRGRITVAAGPSIAASFMPQVIHEFKGRYPAVEICFHDELSDICLDMVREGKSDLAITPAMGVDGNLVSRSLFNDHLVVLFPSGHPLARKKTLDWADIQDYPQVAVNRRSSLRQTLDQQYNKLGRTFTPAYEVAQVGTLLGLIEAGLGIGVLSEMLLVRASLKGLSFRKISSPSAYRTICVTVQAARTPTPVAAIFLEMCQRVAERKA